MPLFFYNIFIALYRLGIRFASVKNAKAKKWIEGRENIFERLQQQFRENTAPVIWMHCSSLGEFEQGRPVIENLKLQYPQHKILLTFFSPSGFEVQKQYNGADFIFYLPMDTRQNAQKFLAITKPALVVFVKYEFWYYYLQAIHQNNIPLLLISGIFRKDQPFFKWYGGLHRKMLGFFDRFFLQDHQSKQLLDSIGLQQKTIIAGDTRFDRVAAISKKFTAIPYIDPFCEDAQIIVAGSTWPDDEDALQQALKENKNVKLLIAPHEINESHIAAIQKLFPGAVLYSQLPAALHPKANVLVIDNVGMLSRLYKYGCLSYIGGGFTKDGIHNILEAAVYGMPVVFGPNYKKYNEATGLIEAGGAKSFSDSSELSTLFKTLLIDKEEYGQMSAAAAGFIKSNKGATEKILHYIQEKRLLTS